MKRAMGLLVVLVLGLGLLTGCGKKNAVDTAGLERSFGSAEPATQSLVDQTVTAVKRSDWSGALANLQRLASQTDLAPAQETAVRDVIAQVQKAMGGSAEQAAEDADKAMEDMKKSLPGQ